MAGWISTYWMRLAWGASGVLLGLALGWLVGSYTACSRSVHGCEVRVQSIEAAGTWVGGLGTVLALGIAVMTYRRGEQARLDEDGRRIRLAIESERRAFRDAAAVHVSLSIEGWSNDRISELQFTVANDSRGERASRVRLSHTDFGLMLNGSTIESGARSTTTVKFGTDGAQAPPSVPLSERESWLAQEISKTTLEFEIAGTSWIRQGGDDPRRRSGGVAPRG